MIWWDLSILVWVWVYRIFFGQKRRTFANLRTNQAGRFCYP